MPATSQLDKLISITAISVLSCFRMIRDWLRSFSFCIGEAPSVRINDDGCNHDRMERGIPTDRSVGHERSAGGERTRRGRTARTRLRWSDSNRDVQRKEIYPEF